MQELDPALPILVKRGVVRGFQTVLRDRGWATAFGALFGVFLLVQLLLFILVGMEGIQSLLRTRTDLRLEIHEQAMDQDIRSFLAELESEPYVDDVVYVTREQAYENARNRDPELVSFLEEFGLSNPFPETIGVTLKNLEDYDSFRIFIEQSQWHTVVDPTFLTEVTDQEKHVYDLLKVAQAGRGLTATILLVTMLTLIFITTEMVRRRALARSDEVLVERLVGANMLSIILPFAAEAALLFWISIIASGFVLFAFLLLLPTLVPALGPLGALQALHTEVVPLLWKYLPLIVFLEIIFAPVLAGIGTWFGMRPQLKSHTLSISTP